MSCLGVHFAITEQEVETLRLIPDEAERVSHLQEVLEERYFTEQEEFIAQSDKAWDAMHRVLADGQLT